MTAPTVATRINQLQAELTAVNTAILSALAQPDNVSVVGSLSYTNRKLPDLYDARDRIERNLAALQTGGAVSRTVPYYRR